MANTATPVAPLSLTGSLPTKSLVIADASTSAKGAVQLAADNETSATKALKSDDPRLPVGPATPTSRTISTTAPLTGGGDLSANRTLAVSDATTSVKGVVELATSGESAAGVVVQGNDARLSDARTPTAHVHSAADITTGTVATARLGSGTANATTFLRGDQTYAVPAGGSALNNWTRVRRSTNQSLTLATDTVVIWDTEDADTDAFHDVGAANGRLTVPSGQAGVYLVEFSVRFSTSSSGLRQVTIRLNGTTQLAGNATSGVPSVNTYLSATCVVSLAVGDYVQGMAYSSVAIDVLADQATHMVLRRLS